MHGGKTAHNGAILHCHMPREGTDIRDDDVVAELAIVRHMRIGQQVVMRPNHRGIPVAGRTVDGNVFTKSVVGAYPRPSRASIPFQILRPQPNRGKRVKSIFGTDLGMTINHHVRMQLAVGSQGYIWADHTVRTNATPLADLRALLNHCGGVNLAHHASSSINMKVTDASLTSSPATEHLPTALPILPRDLVSSTSMVRISPGNTGLRHFTFSAAIK